MSGISQLQLSFQRNSFRLPRLLNGIRKMTRRKNQRRLRRKQEVKETLDQSSRDASCFALSESDTGNKNDTQDSILETNLKFQNVILQSPEAVMDDSEDPTNPMLYKDLSPEIIGKVSKIKLNLDIPDCESERILQIEPVKLDLTLENLKPENLSPQDNYSKLESVKLEPVDVKLNDYLLDKTVSVDSTMHIELETKCTEWCKQYYSTANSLSKHGIPAMVSGGIETFCTEDVKFHGEDQIFPTRRQMEILKTVSEPETLRVQKYMNQKTSTNLYKELDKPQSIYTGHENICDKTNRNMNVDNTNCSRSSSPPAKRSRTALRFESEIKPRKLLSSTTGLPFFNSSNKDAISPVEDDSEYAKALKTCWITNSSSSASVQLPPVSDLDGKASGFEIESQLLSCQHLHSKCIHCNEMEQTSIRQEHILIIPFTKITELCSWLAKKIVELLRKGSSWIRETMTMNVQHPSAGHPDTSVLDELTQLVTTMRYQNDHTVSILSEKVTHLSEELIQVRVRSESALATLTTELSGMRETNNILTGEIKSLHTVLDNMQSKPPLPPPPPPPPPPLQPIIPTTPTSSRSVRTPNRKCSTPLQQTRPAITVDDLLKVTLKKAPRNSKENKGNSSVAPRGPAVSLDMLRSVKLKSARRRSVDQNARSPRSTSLSMRSRPLPSISLSPIMAGKEGPLSRILRQVDTNKRGSKRSLSSPTHSGVDLTKASPRTFSIARYSKSHTVML